MTSSDLNPTAKPQTLVIGVVAGAIFGLIAAVLYSRASEEERRSGGEIQPLQVGQIIALALASLGLIRQITEMGRPRKARGP